MTNILITKTGALGDVLRTTVLLEGLHSRYAAPRIHWLTSKSAKCLLENNPFIEKLFFKEDPTPEYLRYEYDLIVSLEEDPQLLQSTRAVRTGNLFGVYLGKDGKARYTNSSSMWYDMSLISRFGKDVADKLKRENLFSYPELLYKMLNLDWQKQRYRLFLTLKDIKYANILRRTLSPDKPVIGFVTGAGGRWPMKTLSLEKQVTLLKMLHKTYRKQVSILVLTGPNQLELQQTSELKKYCPFIVTHDIQDLDEFIGIANLCDLIITPDTLSMHIAIALVKKVVAYFTVTSAAEIELYAGHKILAEHVDYCSYSKELKKHPNIADFVSLEAIVKNTTNLLPL
jgi:heptosyltransferase II